VEAAKSIKTAVELENKKSPASCSLNSFAGVFCFLGVILSVVTV
jgi:hypothetical protein